MADRFNVDTSSLQYGSVGGAVSRAMQTELLRRQQMQEAAQAEAQRRAELEYQHGRNAAQDTRQHEVDTLNKQVALGQLASQEEARKSAADARVLTGQKQRAEMLQKQLELGQPVDPAIVEAEKDNPFLAGVFTKRAKTGPALRIASNVPTPTVPNGPDFVGPEAPPEMPTGPGVELPTGEIPGSTPETIYRGTPEQQQAAKVRQFADDFVAGKMDDQFGDADAQQLAAAKLVVRTSGGAGLATALAALMKPAKPASETMASDNLAIEKVFYDRHLASGMKPEDARVAARKDYNELQDIERKNRQQITVQASFDRQSNSFADMARRSFKSQIERENTALLKDLERADRARKMLTKENFVADAIAAPEVLQIVAGGMGSGLRMTDAELNRINNAQTKLEQWRGQAAKLPGAQLLGIEGKTIQDNMRNQMKEIIAMVEEARQRHHRLQEDTLRKIGSATSPEEAYVLEADYWGNRREATELQEPGKGGGASTPTAPAAGLPKPSPGAVGYIDPKTGKFTLYAK